MASAVRQRPGAHAPLSATLCRSCASAVTALPLTSPRLTLLLRPFSPRCGSGPATLLAHVSASSAPRCGCASRQRHASGWLAVVSVRLATLSPCATLRLSQRPAVAQGAYTLLASAAAARTWLVRRGAAAGCETRGSRLASSAAYCAPLSPRCCCGLASRQRQRLVSATLSHLVQQPRLSQGQCCTREATLRGRLCATPGGRTLRIRLPLFCTSAARDDVQIRPPPSRDSPLMSARKPDRRG